MIKLFHILIAASLMLIVMNSCELEDRKARHFYHADGKWSIESFETITYDTAGTVVNKEIISNLGYLQFMQSGSLNALYYYRLGVYMKLETFSGTDSTSYKGYSMEYVYDGERFDIRGLNATLEIDGTYAVTEKGSRKMELQILTPFSGLPKYSIYQRRVMVLKK